MAASSEASNGLLAQAKNAGQEPAHQHHAEKTQGPPGLLQQSHAAGQAHSGEQQLAGKLPNETFEEFIIRSRKEGGGNEGGDAKDGYERGRQRSLPDEEKDKTRGR